LGFARINSASGAIGIELTVETMQLGTGDSLIIKESSGTSTYYMAVGNGYTNTGKWIFNSNNLHITFKSNSDANVGSGFSLLFRRLYENSALQPDIAGVTGNALLFETKTGSLRSGGINNNVERGRYSTGMGYKANATGDYSTALGYLTNASGNFSTAMGYETQAIGFYSTTMGEGTDSYGYAGTTIGMYNNPLLMSPQSMPLSTTPLFIIGNGSYFNKSNAMVVRKDGNVGIGTDFPRTKLHIDYGADANLTDNAGYLVIGDVGSSNVVFDNNEILARDNGANSTLFLQNNGGNLQTGGSAAKPGGGTWDASSDARLKQNVSPYNDGLKQLLKIKPVNYQYNNLSGYNTQKQYIGVIAQELREVAPYMVGTFTKNNIEYLNVDNSAMTYMLINAVKEQQNQIEELKALVNQILKIDNMKSN
jgi:Chaperone of endosialidase/Head domain of trimeric autotransporter adhesin